MRLTLLYSGLFLLLGTTVIVVIVVLTGQSPIIAHVSVGPTSASAHPIARVPQPFRTTELVNGLAAQRSSDVARVFTASWAVLIVTTLGSAVLGWFAAGRVLRPLRSITATARTISAGNLHERLALTGPEDEFKALGDTLDDLLARLEASFDAQRRFVANASHELRTPLTLERTLLQVALADPNASAETLRATGQELLELQTEHERMLEALLTLASSERALECREAIDLPVLVEAALHRANPAVAEKGLEVDTSLEGPATIRGDHALVERLIANLIDNAVEHNVPHGRIEVRTAPNGGGTAVLTVSSTGPPIPADEVERLFEPFQRLDRTRTNQNGHHGLGLSIVRAIASAHDARLAAQARPGGGLTVTVDFPAAPR
ncbi:MAG TPA: ATP-binding protein [Solirubrobacteraceae bacterium]|nr:ATP-binding protein [Solirubrobacteraceae bacterium]